MIIYKLTSPNNKCYIGQTKSNLENRLNQHIKCWKRWSKTKNKKGSTKLFYALELFDISKWKTEIIFECESKEELDEKEKYFIQFYDSIENGYNITKGGSGVVVENLSEEHKQNLSSARKEYFESDDGKKWKKFLSKNFKENNPSKNRQEEIREQNSKSYLVLDKFDNEIIVKNLSEFKRNNPNTIIQTFPNNYKSKYCTYSDFRCVLLKDYSEDFSIEEKNKIIQNSKELIKPLKKWKVISPINEEFLIFSLKEFCETQSELIPQCLGKVALKKTESYKGWKCELIS